MGIFLQSKGFLINLKNIYHNSVLYDSIVFVQ